MAVRHCMVCGTEAKPRSRTRGSFLIELVLWLMFIVPGLLYSLWRLSTREKVCPACGSPNMVPLDSPAAEHHRRMLGQAAMPA